MSLFTLDVNKTLACYWHCKYAGHDTYTDTNTDPIKVYRPTD